MKKEEITEELVIEAEGKLERATKLLGLKLKSGYLSDDEEQEMKDINDWINNHQIED